jgi:hypothetical protein
MGTTNFVNLLDQISVSLRIKWREMRHEGFTSRPLLVAFPRDYDSLAVRDLGLLDCGCYFPILAERA